MAFDEAESLFYMKPAALIEQLARQFVDQQVMIAKVRQITAELPDDDPRAVQFRAQADQAIQDWVVEGVPQLAATFRLALEVLDTYGPDGVRVEDEIDASIWDNKYFVWLKEFGGTPPEKS